MGSAFGMPHTRRAVLNMALSLPALAPGCATETRPVAAPSHTPDPTVAGDIPPSLLPERHVGLAYSLWHRDNRWQDVPAVHKPWGTPEAGFYRSDDPAILSRHAAWLSGAGVDFVIVDWSNDLGVDIRQQGDASTLRFIESSTTAMFDNWINLGASPRIALMIGNPGDKDAVTDGRLKAKADEVHDLFVANPSRARLLQTYLGKPLLLVYVGTPSPWGHGLPPWVDSRFTVRFVTGFLTQQETLLGPGDVSRFGYWSWEDRRQPTYSIFQGYPECMTIVAAWRGQGSPGRDNGHTYVSEWERARRIGPRFVLAGTFNEWWVSEQINVEASKDVEPSKEHGWQDMDILKQQAALFKVGQ
jgi:hypothetical protein